jgi:glycosyltransferase involved in cell wall biosynthesis
VTKAEPVNLRVCIVYDCLFPHTIGGAELWYRNLAERLASDGHHVTYLTLRQWDAGTDPGVPGVDVRAVGPRMRLYKADGPRRILPPIVFGTGVLLHLLRQRRRYDIVHTASFPYFSLLAAAASRPRDGYRLFVDWHEVWTRTYWREYLGRSRGDVGWLIQRLCARARQHTFCFSELHARRLDAEGVRGDVTILPGEYAGDLVGRPARPSRPLVVFAGRLIPEKRVTLGVDAVAIAAGRIPGLRAVFFGDGPDYAKLAAAIDARGIADMASAPGFVATEEVQATLQEALCMLLPSRREGYGMVVVEASACATPSVVVLGEDNAATELVEDGVNGFIVSQPTPNELADAIVRVHETGLAMRERTAAWFSENAPRLALNASLDVVLHAYGTPATSTHQTT